MATNDDRPRRKEERHEQKSLQGHHDPELLEAHKEAARLEAYDPAEDEVVPAVTADVDETPKYVQYGAAILLGLAFGVGCYLWIDGGVPSAPQNPGNTIKMAPTEQYFASSGTYQQPSAQGVLPDPFESPFEPTLEEVPVQSATVTEIVAVPEAAQAESAAAPAPAAVVYLFATDDSAVPETAELTAIAEKAKKQGLTLDVRAYTDEHGRAAYNKRLSEKRARAVGDYLIAHGVPGAKVKVRGMGPTHAYANDAQDRRAEVSVEK